MEGGVILIARVLQRFYEQVINWQRLFAVFGLTSVAALFNSYLDFSFHAQVLHNVVVVAFGSFVSCLDELLAPLLSSCCGFLTALPLLCCYAIALLLLFLLFFFIGKTHLVQIKLKSYLLYYHRLSVNQPQRSSACHSVVAASSVRQRVSHDLSAAKFHQTSSERFLCATSIKENN